MAGKSSGDFESWLVELLDSANVDGEIYASYISGTLQTLEGSSLSEIEEALADILSACLVSSYILFGLYVKRIAYM